MLDDALELEPPQTEPPDFFITYLQMKNANITTYWGTGWGEQPHVFMLEMEACRQAENEHEARLAFNALQGSKK